ncbi:MAG: putative metal-binding motif-containing protein [Acidobacteria bacterium]|nr:putative metal-binding motif-containing protein [Acidobacteriota bacterium]
MRYQTFSGGFSRVCLFLVAGSLLFGAAATTQAQLTTADTATGGLTAEDLVDILLGPGSGAIVSNVTLTGDPRCAGTFAGGTSLAFGTLGIDSGVILSSGRVNSAVGPNTSDSTSTGFGTPGDPFLQSLIPSFTTFDACVLEFDFVCDDIDVVSFQYVFGSEEYNEFANTPFNNVFGFEVCSGAGGGCLNNIALVPCNNAFPVSINNVNCGNPFNPASAVCPNQPFCDLFINNDLDDGGPVVDVEADGLSTVFGAQANIGAGTNHVKLAISDAGDSVLDTWVFLEAGSFSCGDLNSPICESSPGETTGVVGTGTATDSQIGDVGIAIVELEPGAINAVLVINSPTPTTIGLDSFEFDPPVPSVSYTVQEIIQGQFSSATVRVTDGTEQTCTSEFTSVPAGPVTDLTLCQDDDLQFLASNETATPAGTATCDTNEFGEDPNEPELPTGILPSPAADPNPCRTITLDTPIESGLVEDVTMVYKKEGPFDPELRLLLSRQVDGEFQPYEDVTAEVTQVATIFGEDPTRIRSIGVRWSPVKVTCGILPNCPAEGVACSFGVGACANPGTTGCDAQNETACLDTDDDPVVPGAPSVEVCDGVDNDCDGQVDEPLVSSTSDPNEDDIDDSRDIKKVSATSGAGVVTVTLELYGNADINKGKYKVHYDVNLDTVSNSECVTTSDYTQIVAKKKKRSFTGPGSAVVDGMTITYKIDYADLIDPVTLQPLESGDTLFIWADTLRKEEHDRAPDDIDASDSCEKPQLLCEVTGIILL